MFIEKLTPKDAQNLINSILAQTDLPNYMLQINRFEFDNRTSEVKFGTPYFHFSCSDFTFNSHGLLVNEETELNKQWIGFMYGKFGEEYKQAFFAHRAAETEAAMVTLADKYNATTAQLAQAFKAEPECEK